MLRAPGRVIVASVVLCECRCHATPDEAPTRGVPVTDAIGAVTACVECQNAHIPALFAKPKEPKAPWVDPPHMPDKGEGAE
jgi:hypothetical protein